MSATPPGSQRPRRRVLWLALIVVAVLGLTVVLAVQSLRWRVQVVALHAIGAIPDVEWVDVVTFVKPGSGGYNDIARLIETRNPYPVVQNPHATTQDVAAGAELFAERCSSCHGTDAGGGPAAPALTVGELKHGNSDWAMYRTIRLGVPGTAMQAQPLNSPELWRLIAFLKSHGSAAARGDTPQARTAAVDVPYEDISAVGDTQDDWLTFSGSYSAHRHSALAHLGPQNVGQLAVRWVHQFDRDPPKIEASPLVRNGIMFLTVPNGRVIAIDARNGKQLWKFERKPPAGAAGGEFGMLLNRGVALLDDKVFVGTGDARLLALSSASGKVLWDVAIAEAGRYYISAAPLAYRDLVVTGVGTKGGGRGVIVAVDAKSGKERWRFVAIPGPGEVGNDSWAGESWREGGAPTWMTGAYDAQRDLLVWGAGNPKPDYDAALRRGDNLYSNTALGLRGSTGELLWHFQFTPADDKDWDSNQVPILADFDGPSGKQPRVLWANRNGFYYVLDRVSGAYVSSQPFVQQTWTAGIDPQGRPLPPPAERSAHGAVIYPGNVGGTNWWPPSFDAARGLVFVPAIEQGMLFFPTQKSWPRATGKPFYTVVRALDAATGKPVWESRNAPRLDDPELGGLLSTSTGLLFGADGSTFFALESQTGRMLWSVQTGGKIGAAPVTYAIDGEQHVVVAAGHDLLAFALPKSVAAQTSAAPSR